MEQSKQATFEDIGVAWLNWTKEFKKAITASNVARMGEDSQAFAACCLNEKNPSFPPDKVKDSVGFKILKSRFNSLGVTPSDAVVTYLSVIAKSPGVAVMYAHGLSGMSKTESKPINMDSLSKWFPVGFFTETALHGLWERQKGYTLGMRGVGNLLDMVNHSVADKAIADGKL